MPAPTFATHTLLAVKNFYSQNGAILEKVHFGKFEVLEPGGIDHSESSRNNQSELIRNSQCTCLAN